jgi:hypothetical protein
MPSPELSPFGSGLIVPPGFNKLGATMAAVAGATEAKAPNAYTRKNVAAERDIFVMI